MIVIPVILLVVAVVVAVVAGLAWSAKLPGNGYVGIRAPEARKSRENWDITHRVAGPPWAVSALAFAGAAALAQAAGTLRFAARAARRRGRVLLRAGRGIAVRRDPVFLQRVGVIAGGAHAVAVHARGV